LPGQPPFSGSQSRRRDSGVELTPTAVMLRRLLHYSQMLQSHALHFFYLASPDLLFGMESDPATEHHRCYRR